MSDFNLPDGCTTEQIDNIMFVDEPSCYDCLFWYPIEDTEYHVGICQHLLDKIETENLDAAKYIVDNTMTRWYDFCYLWEYFNG